MVAKLPELQTKLVYESTEEKEVSSKQLKRIQDQQIREAKKMAKRKAKAEQRERRATEKEFKLAERQRRLEQENDQNSGLSAKQMLKQERILEEEKLFAEEFLHNERTLPLHHVKKSALESNRLGGSHMC